MRILELNILGIDLQIRQHGNMVVFETIDLFEVINNDYTSPNSISHTLFVLMELEPTSEQIVEISNWIN